MEAFHNNLPDGRQIQNDDGHITICMPIFKIPRILVKQIQFIGMVPTSRKATR
jgi:hypothetical protein